MNKRGRYTSDEPIDFEACDEEMLRLSLGAICEHLGIRIYEDGWPDGGRSVVLETNTSKDERAGTHNTRANGKLLVVLDEGNNITEEVDDLSKASTACRKFINRNLLGANAFTGGKVTDKDGNFIATVSYNGCVWAEEKLTDAGTLLYRPIETQFDS